MKILYRQLGIGADKTARVINDPDRLIRMKNVSRFAEKKNFYISTEWISYKISLLLYIRFERWTFACKLIIKVLAIGLNQYDPDVEKFNLQNNFVTNTKSLFSIIFVIKAGEYF